MSSLLIYVKKKKRVEAAVAECHIFKSILLYCVLLFPDTEK